ncbi:peptide chain release factor N(5)-glutamine methyltransferase [Sphaerothrix gracilis]|uniref:peptide chain release factor N(5)-glutamine methyltransferase n=1 Tax=Sphaerothrix gracilis TaxID=3151835 RepID=UPI0031FBAA83
MPFIVGAELWNWWQTARQQASQNAIDPAEADWLLRAVTGLDALALRLATFKEKSQVNCDRSLAELKYLWQQRVGDRVPVQYLVGQVCWRDLTLRVTPDVLIPRPETELIVEIAAELVAQSPMAAQLRSGLWIDLGTGSGAIALGLATLFPQAEIIATDVSAKAVAIAQENAARNSLGDRIQFLQGAWLEPAKKLKGQIAGLISNPPYIPSDTVLALEPEVTRHEPHLALDGGKDGLDCIRHLATVAPSYLQLGGLWLVEIMQGQGQAVSEILLATNSYEQIQLHYDLAGRDRFVSATCRLLPHPS